MREERRAVLARHNGDFRSVTPGRLSDFSKARCVEAGDSYALVYRATYYARNEGGRGLERMREVRISACFAREIVDEIAPWNLSFECKVIKRNVHACVI